MMNLFKKNAIETGKAIQKPEVIEMDAKEALKVSSQKWSQLPTEKIFEEINRRAEAGFRSAYLYGAYINGKQYLQLKEFGFEIEISTRKGYIPYFKVSW